MTTFPFEIKKKNNGREEDVAFLFIEPRNTLIWPSFSISRDKIKKLYESHAREIKRLKRGDQESHIKAAWIWNRWQTCQETCHTLHEGAEIISTVVTSFASCCWKIESHHIFSLLCCIKVTNQSQSTPSKTLITHQTAWGSACNSSSEQARALDKWQKSCESSCDCAAPLPKPPPWKCPRARHFSP